MRIFLKILLLAITFPFFALAQNVDSEALFIPNQGQWAGDFDYKVRLKSGALFFTKTGMMANLKSPSHHHDHDNHSHEVSDNQGGVAVKMTWMNANPNPQIESNSEKKFYYNYFLGKDSSRWKGGVPVFENLEYQEIYPNIDVHYGSQNSSLKYDILLHPDADPTQIKMKYDGVETLEIHEGKLFIETAIGHLTEWIPEAYQMIGDRKVIVKCQYVVKENEVGFKLGRYDKTKLLTIDPVLEFSSFSGSAADNWGFTATPGPKGEFYGGGITLGSGFPTTPGVYQIAYGGSVDVAINKFSSDGTQMLYSTYLGGDHSETPHSLIVDGQGNLWVLGNTGSADFPVSGGAYQSQFSPNNNGTNGITFNFGNGQNLFVAKLSANGKNLMASTYLGGNDNEGSNKHIYKNYGDQSRGEIIILDNGDVAITSTSHSDDLPFLKHGAKATGGFQNALLSVFNSTLSTLRWGAYFGGNGHSTGYSVKAVGGSIYMCGATEATDLLTHSSTVQDSAQGKIDGYIARFSQTNGSFLACTYIGTPEHDQAFLLEIDRFGDLYVFGQSRGSMPITAGRYGVANSFQFLQKYAPDLSTMEWGTQVGSGQSKNDLVPTALMVDRCLNIYMSGWNGGSNTISNTGSVQGNTNGLPVTPDAFQSTTDGSDFYFLALDRNADNLLYATYFGGSSNEHVDGGTSRFDPKGTLYQTVCAGCSNLGFPTTPNAYSTTNPSSNCNLGAIKMDLKQTVEAVPKIDFNADVDTICDRLEVKFENESYRGDLFYWDFGNGQTSTDFEPIVVYNQFGTYQIRLIAEDTLCDLYDTSYISLVHDEGVEPNASLSAEYDGCDTDYEVQFANTSSEVHKFQWNFGDGNFANSPNPIHNYSDTGIYQVILIATDTICQKSDTVLTEIVFRDTSLSPEIEVWYPECGNGEIAYEIKDARSRHSFVWHFSGEEVSGPEPDIRFSEPGFYQVLLEITDSACDKTFKEIFDIQIDDLGLITYAPNAFSPNGDGINETFAISGDNCSTQDNIRIFNRWGEVVFASEKPFEEFWDGAFNDKPAPQGVYTFVLRSGDREIIQHLTLFR